MNVEKIREIIKSKHTLYDLRMDQRKNKMGKGMKLNKLTNNDLPDYIFSKRSEFTKWFD